MKTILIFLLPLFIYAGSSDATIECKSASGRTLLNFYDSDAIGNFNGGKLSIDNYTIQYDKSTDATIVQNLKHGVYTLEYYHENQFLTFYALPKSVKDKSKKGITNYTFSALITPSTTDPRTQSRLNKTIHLKCTYSYNWKDI